MRRSLGHAAASAAFLVAGSCAHGELRDVAVASIASPTEGDASAPSDDAGSKPDGDVRRYNPGPEVELTTVVCERNGQLGRMIPDLPATMKAPSTTELGAVPDPKTSLRVYSDGVLAMIGPAGWRCQGNADSATDGLVLAPPDPHISNEQLWTRARLTSEVVTYVRWHWGTSGRISALRVGGPVFPGLVAQVLDEEGVPFTGYPTGYFRSVPWVGEKLEVHGKRAVFEDPPWTNGTGTQTGIAPSSRPIRGVLINTRPEDSPDDAMILIAIRLAAVRAPLFDTIRADIEARMARCRRAPPTDPKSSECWGTTEEMYTGPKG